MSPVATSDLERRWRATQEHTLSHCSTCDLSRHGFVHEPQCPTWATVVSDGARLSFARHMIEEYEACRSFTAPQDRGALESRIHDWRDLERALSNRRSEHLEADS